MNNKKTIMVISDHFLAASGVGSQTGYIIKELSKTGKYRFVCLAGAMKHASYQPQKYEDGGAEVIVFPVDGYGDSNAVRNIIRNFRPDLLLFISDPRFYTWLWQIENEVRPNLPMIYYHVWDNKPSPHYNKLFYQSTDVIATISKLTNEIVKEVSPTTDLHHIPHAVPHSIFKTLPEQEVKTFRDQHFPFAKNKLLFFWNNRNARRKQSGTLIWWFKEWLDKVGHDKACLLMHTDPKDPHGQDLVAIIQHLGLRNQQIIISDTRTYNPPLQIEQIAQIYNAADCTINISNAEGFGLGTLESLSCGTPIIVSMTGGLAEQVTDGKNFFGFGIKPASRPIIGSQETPFIWEDLISQEDFEKAMTSFLNLSPEERRNLGKLGQEHVRKNYNFDQFVQNWKNVIEHTLEKYGSWENRKGYNSWELRKL